MKIKTSEAKDQVLDHLVAKCEGGEWIVAHGLGAIRGVGVSFSRDNGTRKSYVLMGFKDTEDSIDNADGFYSAFGNRAEAWQPSTDWSQGGPIIEREGICLSCVDTVAPWDARIYDGESEPCLGEGDTPLIAAMRCYVASKLGDEVEIPEELEGITA